MAVSLSAKGVQSESEVASGQKPVKGRYMAMISKVDETMERKDQVIVDFKVLAGNVPDQADRVITEYFSISEKALPRLTRLAMCAGLLKPDEVADVSFSSGLGRVLFIEVEDHEYEKDGKKNQTVRVSFGGMWSLGNPDVADLLKVPEIAAKIAQLRSSAPTQNSAPAANQTPQTQPTGGGANKWAGIV